MKGKKNAKKPRNMYTVALRLDFKPHAKKRTSTMTVMITRKEARAIEEFLIKGEAADV